MRTRAFQQKFIFTSGTVLLISSLTSVSNDFTKPKYSVADAFTFVPTTFLSPSKKMMQAINYFETAHRHPIRSFPISATSSSQSDPEIDEATHNSASQSQSNQIQAPNQSVVAQIKRENDFLKKQIQELTEENERLEKRIETSTLVLETFEGEGTIQYDAAGFPILKWYEDQNENDRSVEDILQMNDIDKSKQYEQYSDKQLSEGIASARKNAKEIDCDPGPFGSDVCPVEPEISFKDALRDRAYWLVGLLALQSCSGFILARNELLLQKHPVIVYFLTMLVGAGGNAGNQASVRVIRGLALGTLNDDTQQQFLFREFKMAISLSLILSTAGFLRAVVFRTPLAETIAITSALSLIVLVSICLGAVLPILLKKLGIDPAHSSTSIQVIMDILGVVLTVFMSTVILDSPIGQFIFSKLSMF